MLKELYKALESTIREADKMASKGNFDEATRLLRIADDTVVYAVNHCKCSNVGLFEMLNYFHLDIDYIFGQLAMA